MYSAICFIAASSNFRPVLPILRILRFVDERLPRRVANTTLPVRASSRTRGCASGRTPPSPALHLRTGFLSAPMNRPASITLAASRFTSHSQGAGSVSSKSLMSNTSLRSGAPNPPKFSKWRSPHACTRNLVEGVPARSAAMQHRRAPVKRERRLPHPPVPDRQQRLHAPNVRLLQQRNHVRPVRRYLPFSVLSAPNALPQRLSHRHAILHRRSQRTFGLRIPFRHFMARCNRRLWASRSSFAVISISRS